MMKFRWLLLLPSLLSVFLLSSAAQAAKLIGWRFDTNQNQLMFTTDSGVQPKAQLIADPARLVIDLPGTNLGRPTLRQSYGGAIREVRVGQFNTQTTRIVVELAPGYTIDPQQVKFRGFSANQWSVQLPTPQRIEASTPQPPANSPSKEQSPAKPVPIEVSDEKSPSEPQPPEAVKEVAGTQLERFQVTQNGLYIQTRGGKPDKINVRRSDDQTIDIDLVGATLSNRLGNQAIPVNRYGVNQIQFSPLQTPAEGVRIRLSVREDSPDWKAVFGSLGGLVLLPEGTTLTQLDRTYGQSGSQPSPSLPSPTQPSPSVSQLARVQAVELTQDGTQLLIRADRTIQGTSSYDIRTNTYQVTIAGAQLADNVQGPRLTANSLISQVKLQQQDSNTVVVAIAPSQNALVGSISQLNERVLSLPVRQRRELGTTPAPVGSIPVPAPPEVLPPTTTTPMPRVPNTRVSVVIDPGHGGKDPGAVGIGGLREKDVILPISLQVAAILEQNGVQAILTRSDDRFISLAGRTQMANRTGAELFVSIHANAISMSRPDVNGIETFYFASGQRLAQTIQSSMLQSTGMNNRGVKRARFYVLRNTAMPAVLVEVGFVTGRSDAPKLADPAWRSRMAEAIARGILQYVQQNY